MFLPITRRRAIAGLGGVALAGRPGAGRGQAAPTDPSVAAAESTPYDAQEDLDRAMEDYIDRMGFRSQPGVIVQSGTARVDRPSTDPEWPKLRMMAYESALLSAQSEVVKSQNSTQISDSVQRIFRAAQDTPPPFQASQLDQRGVLPDLMRRVLAVARGRLDAELRELGVDIAELERAPEPQRHVMAARSLRTTAMTRAVAEVVGYCPVRTFEAHDGRGNFTIGVVLIGSERMRNLVQQITSRRGEFTPDMERARDIRALVADRRALVDDFGIRLVYDQAGLPVIVSFYQWGSSYRGTDSMRLGMERDHAREQAQANADRQIAEFLSASATYTRNSETGREIEAVALRHADNFEERQPSSLTVTDGMLSVMRRRARSENLAGLTTLANWSERHPIAQQQVVGCVRTWSAAAERSVRNMREGRPAPSAPAQAPAVSGPTGVRAGRDHMNSRDF